MPAPPPGRGVALGIVAATLSLVAGVLVASQTVDAIDPLYRFGREVRPVRPAPAPAVPTEPAFAPIRWSGFAAMPPLPRDPYDDPALLAEATPRPVAAEPAFELPPPEPVRQRPKPRTDALPAEPPVEPALEPAVEPLDLPPPIAPAEIGEAG